MKNSALSFDTSMRGNATNQSVPCANAFCRERTPADDIRRVLSPLFFGGIFFSFIKSIRIHFLHFLHQLLFVHPLLYFILLLLSANLLASEEDNLSKALVYYCFLIFRRIGECISVDLPRPFYLCFVCLEQFPTLAMFFCCCSNCLNYLSFFFLFFYKLAGRWMKIMQQPTKLMKLLM